MGSYVFPNRTNLHISPPPQKNLKKQKQTKNEGQVSLPEFLALSDVRRVKVLFISNGDKADYRPHNTTFHIHIIFPFAKRRFPDYKKKKMKISMVNS